jgi:plasmid stabilization system protein ParE
MRLIVSEAAAADLARLHAFLADKSPAAADRAATALITAMQSLDLFPERGRPSGTPNVRELIMPFGRSGYVLRYAYSMTQDEVVIIRIWHGREMRE